MRLLRIPPIAVLGAAAALAVGAPAAGATVPIPFGGFGSTPVGGQSIGSGVGAQSTGAGTGTSGCGPGIGSQLVGRTGGQEATICNAGLVFVGPAVGQVSSVIGPTIISPAVVGNSFIVSGGSVAVGVGP
jgi:hypothetical protein